MGFSKEKELGNLERDFENCPPSVNYSAKGPEFENESAASGDEREVLFADMDISSDILHALSDMGIKAPTTIQQRAIPIMMEGRDLISLAPTGTGKTCAFGIPLLEYVHVEENFIQELVLAPTRELAQQIQKELQSLAKYIPNVRIGLVYGGEPIVRQIKRLKSAPNILVATPGRLIDLMHRGAIRLNKVHTLVLDEADEMLKMGFLEDVTSALKACRSDRLIAMFSATSNNDVMTMSWKWQTEPVEIRVEAELEDKPKIEEYIISLEEQQKKDGLLYLLDSDDFNRVMIFTNTKFMADSVCNFLKKHAYKAECIHGDVKQKKRTEIMNSFKKAQFPILVATDVAARGIDVFDVEAVINFELPLENEYYLHRIGRTGRAKREGVAFSLVSFKELVRMDQILKYIEAEPKKLHINAENILVDEEEKPFFDNI